MRTGRPTKYKPEMCDTVIECGKQGMSRAEICLELDIHHSTLLDWEQNKPDFSEALKESRRLCQGVWEAHNRKVCFGNADTNATVMIFNMKNRFPDDWSDKKETKHSGDDTSPVTVKWVDDDE